MPQTLAPGSSAMLENKELISDQLWARLVARIVKDEGMAPDLAERVLDQALGFLRLCAAHPSGDYSPSALVDIGWHTFILYTHEYAEFCARVGGGFIHHSPSDEEGVEYSTGNLRRTMEALAAFGVAVDEPLWANVADCSTYCSGDSCSGGGGDGDNGCRH